MPDSVIHHDAFVRVAFSDLENAASLFRATLPPALLDRLDLDSLHLEDGSYISDEFRNLHTDLLFRVPNQHATDTFIYLLFEHKSWPDRHSYIQIMGYLQQFFCRQLAEDKLLLPVIPVLFYHGERSWGLPLNFSGQFAAAQMQPGIREFLPSYEHIVLDVSIMDLDRMVLNSAVLVILRLLRDIRRDDLPEHIDQIFAPLAEIFQQEKKLAILSLCLRYIYRKSGVSISRFREVVSKLPISKESGIMPTLEQQLIEIGKKEGIREGELIKAIDTARKLRDRGIEIALIADVTGLTESQLREQGIQ